LMCCVGHWASEGDLAPGL